MPSVTTWYFTKDNSWFSTTVNQIVNKYRYSAHIIIVHYTNGKVRFLKNRYSSYKVGDLIFNFNDKSVPLEFLMIIKLSATSLG